MNTMWHVRLFLLALLAVAPGAAFAQQKTALTAPPPPAPKAATKAALPGEQTTLPLAGLGANSKEPVKIDANRLEVFDRDKKAVFSGDVVVVQGETTMRCSTLTVLYQQNAAPGAPARPASGGPIAGGADNGIRKLDCVGPVTVVAKDQIATADHATYDKSVNKVFLSGNAKLSQGQNVTTGARVVYDLTTSQAIVENKPGERVRALLVPGSAEQGDAAKAGAGAARGAAGRN